ncbi:MAG: hypothetical protein K2W96_00365, partial [Gemmataceae bacterium]|nr:hypothetical protein [Gemmataceae bacterium]
MLRRLLAALAILSLAFAVTAQAQSESKAGKSKVSKGKDKDDSTIAVDPKVVVGDSLARQVELKKAFELFRTRLSILANRMESGSDADKAKAKQIKKALDTASELGTEGKFEKLIRDLSRPSAEASLDAITDAVKGNAALRADLKRIIALLVKDDSADKKKEMDKMARLLEQLKELIAKQERVRAQTEMGRKDHKALEKDQGKVTKETKETATG